MKKIFVLLLVIGLSLKVYSQNHIKQDTLLQKSFEELSELFYTSKPDTLKATIYAKKYFSKALKEKDTMRMISGKYFLADILNNEDIYLNFCDSLINVTQKKTTKNFPASIYLDKGKYYYFNSRIDQSLNQLLNVKKATNKIKNDSLLYITKMMIGVLKHKQKKYKESQNLYKEVYHYALKNNYIEPKSDFYSIILNIPFNYMHLKKYDSAIAYCKKAESIYKMHKDSSFYLSNLNYAYGTIYFKMKKYPKSILSLKKAIPSLINDNNYTILASNFSRIAISYDSLNQENKALKYHLKVDSLLEEKHIFSKSLISSCVFLKNYYKANNNFKEELHYLNRIIKIRKKYTESDKNFNKIFTEKYDIPNLLAEKKQVIEKLENEVQESRRNKIIYISLLVFLLVLISYQINKKRVYKKRFAALMKQNEATKTKEIEKNITQATSKHELSDDTVTTLMEGLEMFETHEDFLNSKINLQLLADRLDTNTSYLSKVINQYKNTSFSNYVNQLRIEYAIEKLKNDTLWRKYTVKAIAQEVGFKNSESFSKAFYKFTGIKPSYFIKELEKTETN